MKPRSAQRLVDLDRRYTGALARAGAGELDRAAADLGGVIAERPDFLAAYITAASALIQNGRPGEAVALLQTARARGLESLQLADRLGVALGTDRSAAIDAWMRAVDLVPDDYDTLFNVGVLLAGSSEPARALPYLRRFANAAPPARYAADIARVRQTIAAIERGGR
jgi:tetratricopeptide (TPR) repeat protein